MTGPKHPSVRQRCRHPRWLRCYLEHCGHCADYGSVERTKARRLVGGYSWVAQVVELMSEDDIVASPSEGRGGVPHLWHSSESPDN